MTDYQEQQEDEIEALRSIFDSEFTGIRIFQFIL